MDYHGPLQTLYYKLKKLDTLNYMDSMPFNTLLRPSTPFNTLKMFKATGLSTLKRILQPRERGGQPVGTEYN